MRRGLINATEATPGPGWADRTAAKPRYLDSHGDPTTAALRTSCRIRQKFMRFAATLRRCVQDGSIPRVVQFEP